jgi:predicted N-acetyltransferase YhbS
MIRPMTTEDVAGADRMLRRAFAVEADFATRLNRYRAIEPEAWLVDEEDGAIAGTVGAVVHDGLAYVGLMGVAPARQGEGRGRRLLEPLLDLLAARGVGCAVLDATVAGAPLYERLGFVDAGVTHERVGAPREPAPAAPVAPLSARDEAALRDLDAALFGVRRDRLWTRLLDERRGQVRVHRDRRGAIDGYLCALPEALGPWGARDPEVAAELLAAALAAGATPRALVPGDNADALVLLDRAGLAPRRTLRHMRRGMAPAPLDWRAIYGKGSYCVG